MLKKILYVLPVVIYSVLIFYFSSLTPESLPPSYFISFYSLAHLIEYFFYGVFARLAYLHLPVIIPIIIGILFAASDEFHQAYVPLRNPSLVDWVIDSVGVVAGVITFNKVRRRFYERKPERI